MARHSSGKTSPETAIVLNYDAGNPARDTEQEATVVRVDQQPDSRMRGVATQLHYPLGFSFPTGPGRRHGPGRPGRVVPEHPLSDPPYTLLIHLLHPLNASIQGTLHRSGGAVMAPAMSGQDPFKEV